MFLWISVFNYPCFCGYPFGYPRISMVIHALTCYEFSIKGNLYKRILIKKIGGHRGNNTKINLNANILLNICKI